MHNAFEKSNYVPQKSYRLFAQLSGKVNPSCHEAARQKKYTPHPTTGQEQNFGNRLPAFPVIRAILIVPSPKPCDSA